jgi:hypothetical protein
MFRRLFLGHWQEMKAIGQARGALAALAELPPDTAELVVDGRIEEVTIASLDVGDVVLVRPGPPIHVIDPAMLSARTVKRPAMSYLLDGHRWTFSTHGGPADACSSLLKNSCTDLDAHPPLCSESRLGPSTRWWAGSGTVTTV